jgi:hypothetical protein
MKRFILTFALALLPMLSFSQDGQSVLFGDWDVKFGGYGAPVVRYALNDADMNLWVGGKGAVTFNSTFAVGLAGYGCVPTNFIQRPVGIPNDPNTKSFYACGYGGVYVEYIFKSNSAIHFTADLLCGVGGLTCEDRYEYDDDDYNGTPGNNHLDDLYDYDCLEKVFFVLEPSVNAEFNLLEWMRLDVGVGYRWSPNAQLKYVAYEQTADATNRVSKTLLDKGCLDGLTINLGIKFGKF